MALKLITTRISFPFTFLQAIISDGFHRIAQVKKISPLLFFLSVSHFAAGQNNIEKIDSLKALLKTMPEDTNQVNVLFELSG